MESLIVGASAVFLPHTSKRPWHGIIATPITKSPAGAVNCRYSLYLTSKKYNYARAHTMRWLSVLTHPVSMTIVYSFLESSLRITWAWQDHMKTEINTLQRRNPRKIM